MGTTYYSSFYRTAIIGTQLTKYLECVIFHMCITPLRTIHFTSFLLHTKVNLVHITIQ